VNTVREVAGSPYYRTRPIETLRYFSAKRLFARFRAHDPRKFLRDLGIDPERGLDGYERWRPVVERVVARVQQEAGLQGGVSVEDGVVLYGLVRALRPGHVIETGVAAGVSSSFIGAALIENGSGDLHSIELPSADSAGDMQDGSTYAWSRRGVGWAIPEEILRGLGPRRTLILEDVRTALPTLLGRLPLVDVFFHDDLHTPDHMLWEFETVWPNLRSGGVLVADDVNSGWVTFCRRHQLPETALQNIQRLAAVRKP